MHYELPKSTVCFVGRKELGGATIANSLIRRKLSKMTKIDKAVREGEDNLDGSQVRGHCIMSYRNAPCTLFCVEDSVARRALVPVRGNSQKTRPGDPTVRSK